MLDLLGGRGGWAERRVYYNRNISTLEPFLESLPQLVLKSCIWTFYMQHNLEKIQGEDNPLFQDGLDAYFFYFTITLSALGTILGVVKFFKEGPVRFLPQAFFTIKYIFAFFTVLLSAAGKVQLLVLMMFYSFGVFQVVSPSEQDGLKIVGTTSQPLCNNLALLQLCSDGFQVRPQVLETNISRSRVTWGDPEWRVFKRMENNGVITFWNTNKSLWIEGFDYKCLEDETWCVSPQNNCGGPKESVRVFCDSGYASIVTKSRLVSAGLWLVLNVIPQFLFASTILFWTQKQGFLHLAMHFPELLASPFITNFIFSRHRLVWCGDSTKSQKIIFNREFTWISVIISTVGQLASLSLMFLYYTEVNVKRNPKFSDFLAHGYLEFSEEFLPPFTVIIFLVLSVLLLALLLHTDDCASSDRPFLAPLDPQDTFLTARGIEEEPPAGGVEQCVTGTPPGHSRHSAGQYSSTSTLWHTSSFELSVEKTLPIRIVKTEKNIAKVSLQQIEITELFSLPKTSAEENNKK